MDPARWTTIQTLFEAALDRDPADRDAFLREAAAEDADLYREVASLLNVEVHTLFQGFAADAVDLPGLLSLDGERVGPYRIATEIGRGGMGAVYRAERDDGTFEQTVALKLVKRGMDSEAIVQRFQQERQILARLQHPHIARLLDGGIADDGRPYFAMEFVRGEPITAYCDARALGIDARLALIEQVCAAVAFAHRSLVVHRDLKPSNILVTEDEDGHPQVKLLDFGIARLIDAEQGSSLTWTGLRPMTPEYAAPEQIRGEPVTTAADVYALGTLLYELLTGRRPHALYRDDPKRLEQAILEEAPTPPSLAVSQAVSADAPSDRAVTPEGVANTRGTSPERLSRRLAGDLDTITRKALGKEIDERYSSAEALAEDIARHRAGLPIRARRATAGYRVRKFVSRHRTGIATAAGVVALLAAVIGVYTARLATERDRAQLEAAKSAEVAEFLTGLFQGSDPLENLGDTLSVRGLLVAGTERIDRELVGQPLVHADLLVVLGDIYLNLGDPARAEPLLRRAVTLRRTHGSDDAALASSLRTHGTALRRADQLDEAEAALAEALRLQDATLGRSHRETAKTLRDLGQLAQLQGDYETAETRLRESLAIQRTVLPDTTPEIAVTLSDLGQLMERVGRLDEAETLILEALIIDQRVYGDEHPHVATDLSNLGIIRREKGDAAAAESAYRQAFAISRNVYGDDHPETATVMRNLASVLRDQEAYDEALDLYERALAIRRDRLGPDHPRVANLLNSLGRLHAERGDLDAAIAIHEEALAIYRRSEHPEPALVAPALHNLASLRDDQGQSAEAEALYRASLATLREALPPGSTDLAFPITSLGTFLMKQEAYPEAVSLLREAVAIRRDKLPPDHPHTALSERRLSDALLGLNQFTEAEAVLNESIARLHEAQADLSLIDQAEQRLASLHVDTR